MSDDVYAGLYIFDLADIRESTIYDTKIKSNE